MITLNKLKERASALLNPYVIFAIIISFSLVRNTILQKQNVNLAKALETSINNISAYEGILSDANTANNVLKLDISSLQASKDNLLNRLDSVKNELKISNKALRTAMVQQTTITASGKDTVTIKDSCEFTKEFKPNELTIVKIELKDDSLSYKLEINNDQYLFIHSEKDWKNKNKKFFKRLVTWDWKKITYYKYDIVNTNPIIQVGKTRVIENTESK